MSEIRGAHCYAGLIERVIIGCLDDIIKVANTSVASDILPQLMWSQKWRRGETSYLKLFITTYSDYFDICNNKTALRSVN